MDDETIELPPEDVQVTDEYVSVVEDYEGLGNTWLGGWRKLFQPDPEPNEPPELRYIDWGRLILWAFWTCLGAFIVVLVVFGLHAWHWIRTHHTAAPAPGNAPNGTIFAVLVVFAVIVGIIRWYQS